MHIYLITGITYEENDKSNLFPDRSQRCFGYFQTFEEAEKAVLNNSCDIWETIHEYAVIEKVEDGIHQYDFNPTWFKWNLEKECYEKVEKPDFTKGYIGWGIG